MSYQESTPMSGDKLTDVNPEEYRALAEELLAQSIQKVSGDGAQADAKPEGPKRRKRIADRGGEAPLRERRNKVDNARARAERKGVTRPERGEAETEAERIKRIKEETAQALREALGGAASSADTLSSPDSGTPATPEPIVAATAGMNTMSEEDQMAAEWAAALAEVERQYDKIEPGQVWARKTEIRGEEVLETIHILEIRSDGIPVIKGMLNGKDNLYFINPNTVEELQALLRQGNYQLGAPASPDVSSGTPEPWTEERLWRELPEGEFVLQNNNGEPRYYRRQGQEFYNRLGKVVPLNDVLDKLKSGRWSIIQTPVPPTEHGGDVLKGRDPKNYDDLRSGDIWVVRDADGKFVKGLRINATFGFASTGDFVNAESNVQEIDGKLVFPEKVESVEAAEAIRSRDWPREEFQQALRDGGYVLEVAGEQNTKASGTRVELPNFDDKIPHKSEGKRPAELILPVAGKPVTYRTAEGELLRIELTATGLYIITNLNYGDTEPEQTEQALRAMMVSEGWQYVESGTEDKKDSPREAMTRDNMQEQIETLDAKVNAARGEFVRIEAEQAAKVNWLLKTFRTLSGKEGEIAPELQAAREAYKTSLAELQSAEIERLKLLDLKGDALRQTIAAIVREYDFEEAERLDDERRAKRYEKDKVPLGAKIQKLWTETKPHIAGELDQAEQLEAWMKYFYGMTKIGAEGVMRVSQASGRAYNKINSTKLGKAALIGVGVAGAGVLIFSGGGAAAMAAGIGLAAKRGLAGAGIAIGAKEAADAYAKRRRSVRSQKIGEVSAAELLGDAKRESLEGYRNNPDLSQSAPQVQEIGLSDTQLKELEQFLKSQTLDQFERRDIKRRRGALLRKSGALFAGVTIGSGALGQVIGAGTQEISAQVRGSGILDPISASVAEASASAPSGAASAPSPAAVASAAEASASAPSGSASAASGRVGGPGMGGTSYSQGIDEVLANERAREAAQALRTSYSQGIDEVLDRAGRAESVGRAFAEARTIASGDTIWKYGVEAAKTAGLDEAGQKRFSGALTQALREKLSMMSPEEAAKYGFYPNKDGLLTPDYIRANDKLDLVGLLGQEKLAALVEQAETGGASGGAAGVVVEERATGVSSDGRVANMKDSIAWSKPDYAPGEVASVAAQEATTPAKVVVDTAVDTKTRLMTEFQSFKKGDILNYVQRLPREEQAEIFRTMRRTVGDLFNTPETSIYADSPQAQYLFTDHPEFAKVSMSRVLEDHQTLSSKAFYMYDRTTNPLHWTQMQEMAKFAEAAQKTLDKKLAVPFRQESIDEYVLRMAAIARATGKTIPGLRMVN